MAKILVADDEPVMRQMVRMACERMGHEVHEAVDAPSAVLAYDRVKPDLLVLDIGMPGGGGLFVLNSLRFGGRKAIGPVLIITGSIDRSADEVRRELAVDRILPKPFRISDLNACVTELLLQASRKANDAPSAS